MSNLNTDYIKASNIFIKLPSNDVVPLDNDLSYIINAIPASGEAINDKDTKYYADDNTIYLYRDELDSGRNKFAIKSLASKLSAGNGIKLTQSNDVTKIDIAYNDTLSVYHASNTSPYQLCVNNIKSRLVAGNGIEITNVGNDGNLTKISMSANIPTGLDSWNETDNKNYISSLGFVTSQTSNNCYADNISLSSYINNIGQKVFKINDQYFSNSQNTGFRLISNVASSFLTSIDGTGNTLKINPNTRKLYWGDDQTGNSTDHKYFNSDDSISLNDQNDQINGWNEISVNATWLDNQISTYISNNSQQICEVVDNYLTNNTQIFNELISTYIDSEDGTNQITGIVSAYIDNTDVVYNYLTQLPHDDDNDTLKINQDGIYWGEDIEGSGGGATADGISTSGTATIGVKTDWLSTSSNEGYKAIYKAVKNIITIDSTNSHIGFTLTPDDTQYTLTFTDTGDGGGPGGGKAEDGVSTSGTTTTIGVKTDWLSSSNNDGYKAIYYAMSSILKKGPSHENFSIGYDDEHFTITITDGGDGNSGGGPGGNSDGWYYYINADTSLQFPNPQTKSTASNIANEIKVNPTWISGGKTYDGYLAVRNNIIALLSTTSGATNSWGGFNNDSSLKLTKNSTTTSAYSFGVNPDWLTGFYNDNNNAHPSVHVPSGGYTILVEGLISTRLSSQSMILTPKYMLNNKNQPVTGYSYGVNVEWLSGGTDDKSGRNAISTVVKQTIDNNTEVVTVIDNVISSYLSSTTGSDLITGIVSTYIDSQTGVTQLCSVLSGNDNIDITTGSTGTGVNTKYFTKLNVKNNTYSNADTSLIFNPTTQTVGGATTIKVDPTWLSAGMTSDGYKAVRKDIINVLSTNSDDTTYKGIASDSLILTPKLDGNNIVTGYSYGVNSSWLYGGTTEQAGYQSIISTNTKIELQGKDIRGAIVPIDIEPGYNTAEITLNYQIANTWDIWYNNYNYTPSEHWNHPFYFWLSPTNLPPGEKMNIYLHGFDYWVKNNTTNYCNKSPFYIGLGTYFGVAELLSGGTVTEECQNGRNIYIQLISHISRSNEVTYATSPASFTFANQKQKNFLLSGYLVSIHGASVSLPSIKNNLVGFTKIRNSYSQLWQTESTWNDYESYKSTVPKYWLWPVVQPVVYKTL